MTATAVDLKVWAETLADEARACQIVDEKSYGIAAERLLGVAALRREIEVHYGPLKKAAHDAWQKVLAAERKMLDPVAEAEAVYKGKIADYTGEQRRLEAEAQAKAETEARRLAELAREHELEQAEAEGADAEEIAAMIAAPLPLVVPQAPPAFRTARGITTATNWRGEVMSLE
jgi:hypothetical protein